MESYHDAPRYFFGATIMTCATCVALWRLATDELPNSCISALVSSLSIRRLEIIALRRNLSA